MNCSRCKVDYPQELLSPLITNGGATKSVCGICALEMSNEIHGVERDHFNGEMAESMRLDAIAWRKKKGIK